MPELPEVETAVRGLRQPVEGHVIVSATFPADPGRMTNISAVQFAERIVGQRVQKITRRAKYLLFHLDADTLMVHLKMTGHLYVVPIGEVNPFDRWLRVSFLLDNGEELRFSDSRKFGRVYLAAQPDEVLPDLGPEPLEDAFTLDVFHQRLAGRKGILKSLLLNQAFVAGIGNIYADESLHIAGLHPLRRADSLTDAEIARLYHAIRQALGDGIRHEGASINWYRKPDGTRGSSQDYLRVYREHRNLDQPCPVCGGPITKIWVGQRGTHFCPTCQPFESPDESSNESPEVIAVSLNAK
ncbi:MAG: bifunctional DNA-formamidopyrimidine glycosylase/DNA-(apurinic or apyrimidinic site) lyase [Chloroflexota bacterium]